jgi:tetratricopeptide (TPR) repeat protein
MSSDPAELTAREAADALWLAAHRAAAAERVQARTRVRSEADVFDDLPEQRSEPPPPPPAPEFGYEPGTQIGFSLPLEPGRIDLPWPGGLEPVELARSPLAGERAIGQALRPFNTRVPSLTELELDEESTAEQAAEEGLWLPVLRPSGSRWFTMVLVVDDSISMLVWRRTVAAFATLLERQGAFRNVLTYRINTDRAERLILRSDVPGAAARGIPELVQPRRVVLVLTDGIGRAWRTGTADRLLAEWGARLPVAVVHLLPRQTWHRTGLNPYRTRLRTQGCAMPNSRLEWSVPVDELYFDQPEDGAGVPIPVLAMEGDSLGWWAELVTCPSPAWSEADVVFAGTVERQPAPSSLPPAEHRTPLERVLRFRSTATPTAFKLATYLAAAPLRLALMQTVQYRMLPASSPAHLSEVMASGLVRRDRSSTTVVDGDEAVFDFDEGIREELLAAGLRQDTARVLGIVGEQLGPHVEAFRHLTDVLTSPDTAQDPPVTPETAPMVRLQNTALRALSGPYLGPVRRLTQALERLPSATSEPAPQPPIRPSKKDSVMSEAHESAVPSDVMTAEPSTQADSVRSEPASPLSTTVRPLPVEQRQPGDPPPVWGNVPARNPNFTGRERLLDDLHQRLQAGTTAVLPEALHGMGGVGKSQIAVEYVYRHTNDYDLIWWIPAEHTSRISSSFVELAQTLGLPGTAEAVLAVPAVREALRTGRPYRNWLLIFDNAESPDAVRQYFPTDGPGQILITSRNAQWANLARRLEVDVFAREESKELLRRRSPELSDQDANDLSAALGDLPLAIEQAAVWRAETGMPAEEYLRLLEEKTNELLGAVETTDYQLSVAAAWNVSLERLKDRNPAALQLLQICAFFAPEPISRNLLSGIRDAPVPPELQAALRDPIRLGRAIREINRYALARIDHRTNTIQLHRLVQAVLIGQLTPEQRDEMRHAAHVLLAAGDPNDPTSPALWPRYAELLPHVYVSAAVQSEDRWVRNLVLNTVEYLYGWGDHDTFLDLSQRAFDAWRERSGEEDLLTLTVAFWLGHARRLLGRYDGARELNARTLETVRRTEGEEHEQTLTMMNMVAADLRIQGDFAAGRLLDEQASETATRVFGGDDPFTLRCRHNLGVSLRQTGDFRAALELDRETLDRELEVIGEDARLTFNTLQSLGLDEMEAGFYQAARNRQEVTALRARRVLGDDNPGTLLVLRALAVTRRRAGDHQSARELSEEALERYRRRYGKDAPHSVDAAANLAVDLRQVGDLQASKSLGQRTLERYRETLGDSHHHTLAMTTNHAITIRLLGNAQAARELNEVTLGLLRSRYGADHPTTMVCAINLASDLAALGEKQAAHDLSHDTLELSRQKLGDAHPTTSVCALNLAVDLEAVGRVDEAEQLRTERLATLRHSLGDEHPAVVQTSQGIRADCDASPMPL